MEVSPLLGFILGFEEVAYGAKAAGESLAALGHVRIASLALSISPSLPSPPSATETTPH